MNQYTKNGALPENQTPWHGKPYYSLDAYCKNTYKEKLYKIALNAGFTCPNRDGTLDTRGCIFCSKGGSGDFAATFTSPVALKPALDSGKERLSEKQTGSKFIAYFQAYTNTYGPVSYLEKIYNTALSEDSVSGISIATRPDCLPKEVLALLKKLKGQYPDKFIWIELGLQTCKEETAVFIRRGYQNSCFEASLYPLYELDIPVIVHLILGLPGETKDDMLSSISYINQLPVWGVKLQLLHILKGTDLASLYEETPNVVCPFPTKEAYINTLIDCIALLRPDIVLHRVTGDAPRSLLLAPLWSTDKKSVLNTLHHEMKLRSVYQGKYYHENPKKENLCQIP